MKRKLTAGLTFVTLPIFVQDTSSTTGGGLSGLTSATSGLVAEYRRQGQASWTAISLGAGTLGTWSSGGIVASGALGGRYEVGIPDAVAATGARWAEICYRGATNMLPVLIEIELDAVNYQDAVAFGLSRLDQAVSAAKTLTTAERTAIANEVESQIIDETDTEKVLQAITNKIAAANPDLSGLTLSAIGIAVRDVLLGSPSPGSLGAALIIAAGTYDRVGLNGSGLTGIGDTRLNNLDSPISGLPASEEIAAAIWDLVDGIEAGESPRQILRMLRAALAGTTAVSGASPNRQVAFRRKDGATVALTVTHDDSGNRTASSVGTL